MSLFDSVATATDAGFSVDGVFEALLTVFGFFRTIIDFLKSFLTPLFKSLFDSLAGEAE